MLKVVVSGAINWDISMFVRRLPTAGEEVEVLNVHRVPGGTGANVAVAVSRLLGAGETAFLGAVGSDDLGRAQMRILEDEGVETSTVKVVGGVESGQAYIAVDRLGENVIHTYLGANKFLLPEDIDNRKVRLMLNSAEVIVVMDPPLPTARKLIRVAEEAGKKILWDPGLYVELGFEKLSPILRQVDYFILNSHELQKLTGTAEVKKTGKFFKKTLLVKQGSKGVTMVKEGELCSINAVPLNRFKLRVVNTVGCGDAFIGAFAAFKALGFEDVEAVKRANCAAGLKATRRETRGSPTMEEFEDFYEKAGKHLKVLTSRVA